MVDTPTATGKKLRARHRADLKASGLSDEQIAASGAYSDSDAVRVQKLLNWPHPAKTLGDCLVFPFPGCPGYSRVKPDNPLPDRTRAGKFRKYESPKETPNRAYILPDTRSALEESGHLVLITEGEKKALKADQEGFPCVGLVGVWGWVKKRVGSGPRELIDDLAAVAWEGREVHLVYDSDLVDNSNVAFAEYCLAEVLEEAGAAVKVVRLPAGPGGEKVGLDDYLVANGADALRGLMAQAKPAERPARTSASAAELPVPAAPAWPAPLAAEAYHGLAGDFVKAVGPASEADPAALLVQLLVGFGSLTGRGPHLMVEADRHGANEYAVLVGRTSRGRKGTSWGQCERQLNRADEVWAEKCKQGGLSSGEGLIWAVRDPICRSERIREGKSVKYVPMQVDAGVEDKRLLVYESEFANVLKQTERQGNVLSTIVRQAWDSGDIRTLTKNNPARATGAHVSIIGHVTAEELRRYLSTTEIANGFGNRFLWVCVDRSKVLPDGGEPDAQALAEVRRKLLDASAVCSKERQLRRDQEAGELWREVYGELSDGKPGLTGSLLGRAEAHVNRLSLIYALLDKSGTIRAAHLLAALAVWEYCERSVNYVFGDALGDGVADELLQLLRGNPKGLTRTEIRDYFQRHASADRLGRALGLLLQQRLARREEQKTAGRSAERWFAGGGGLWSLSSLMSQSQPGNGSVLEKAKSAYERLKAGRNGHAHTPPYGGRTCDQSDQSDQSPPDEPDDDWDPDIQTPWTGQP
jgi:hypothetical protein